MTLHSLTAGEFDEIAMINSFSSSGETWLSSFNSRSINLWGGIFRSFFCMITLDRCDPNNYRPITVQPTLSKILKKVVHDQLYFFLNDNKIITSKQFGFRPKLSNNTALTHFTDNVLLTMDSGRLTGAVFLDLSKASDIVDHNLLLRKLKSVGLSEVTVNWFQSYLVNRKQRTSVGDTLSVAASITVGVPQGSILGPLLFLM